MKRTFALIVLSILVLTALAACQTPQPLPKAPTPIPLLAPATLPPAATPTPRAGFVGISFPTQPPAATDGRAIYDSKCASCHGPDGKGKVEKARNFTDEDYLRGATPVDFFQVITKGQDTMPPFKDALSDAERWNVTYYLWSFAVKPATLAKGKTVYDANCASCHGPDGKGVIPQARKLNDPEYISSFPATQFYQSVSGGKGIMPAWQDRLSAEDRWAAVEYAWAFGYQPLK